MLGSWECRCATLLGGERTEIPVGASLGMNPVPETMESVGRHVDQGYKRIKLKIEPGWDVVILDPVRAEFPDIELTVDANSAYTLDDIDVLKKIDQYGLHYIEQPLHWDDLVDHATLAPQMDTPLCLDETLTSPARVKAAIDLGACSVVNVKVGRVGGLGGHQAHPRSVCGARCADVVRWHVGDRHRPGAQHPRRHHARASSIPATPPRQAARTPATSPNRHSRPSTGSCRFRPDAGIGVTLDRPFLDTVTESVEVLRR